MPELQRSWPRYRERFVNERRTRNGIRFWQENAAELARAEAIYGVPAEIIVGIIGVETIYGQQMGTFRVIDALATLSFNFPSVHPRAAERTAFFRQELEQFLTLHHRAGTDPLEPVGSYAGAMGMPQFMPSSRVKYAVDFDDDGRIDLSRSATDVIGSVDVRHAGSIEQELGQQGHRTAGGALLLAALPGGPCDIQVGPVVLLGEARQEGGGGDGTGRTATDVGHVRERTLQLLLIRVEQRQTPGAITRLLGGVEQLVGQRVVVGQQTRGVVAQRDDGTLDLRAEDERLGAPASIPYRTLRGLSVAVAPGARVLLGFEGGDPSRPVALLWELGDATVIRVNNGDVKVARDGDDVSASAAMTAWMLAVNARLAGGPTPPARRAACACCPARP